MANLGKSIDWPYATYTQINSVRNSLGLFATPHVFGAATAFLGADFNIYGELAYAKNPITISTFDISASSADGRIEMSSFPSLSSVDISGSNVSHANFSKCRNLEALDCTGNVGLIYLNIQCCKKINAIYCADSSISSENIDEILVSLDQYGPQEGIFTCDGAFSGTPSSVGAAAITKLTTLPKNWSIITN